MTTELKRWGDEKPDVGRCFVVYEPQCIYVSKLLMRLANDDGEDIRVFHAPSGGEYCVASPPNTRWCYVQGPPEWEKL